MHKSSFTLIPNEAIDRVDEFSPTAWMLYCKLLMHRNQKTGLCNPSYISLGWDRTKYYRARKELEVAGMVVFDGTKAVWLKYLNSDESKPENTSGYVYVISNQQGQYKIGKAADVNSRLQSLATGSPFELVVILSYRVTNALEEEARLHAQFSAKKIRNEWFMLSDDDVETIRKISESRNPGISDFGTPENPGISECGTPENPEISECGTLENPEIRDLSSRKLQRAYKEEQYEVNNTNTLPTVKRGKRKSIWHNGVELTSEHPAIIAIHKITGRYPSTDQWGLLVDRLGESPDTDKLEACVREWRFRGFNPQNLSGITDWYLNGIENKENKNAKPKSFREQERDNLFAIGKKFDAYLDSKGGTDNAESSTSLALIGERDFDPRTFGDRR